MSINSSHSTELVTGNVTIHRVSHLCDDLALTFVLWNVKICNTARLMRLSTKYEEEARVRLPYE